MKMHPDVVNGRPAPPPPPLWAPWKADSVTLHLVRDVPEDDPVRGLGACARWDVRGNLRGPYVHVDLARDIGAYSGGYDVCRTCTEIALAETRVDIESATRAVVAYDIRAELVCCDSYDVCRPDAFTLDDASYDPEEHPDYHAICYWGEAAARLAEDPDREDCEHVGGSWFDRTLCPEPCGKMHDRCHDCGDPLDSCDVRARSYLDRSHAVRPSAREVIARVTQRLTTTKDASR